jgi:DNA-binding beta-propeller fold protein YncE
MRQVSTLQLKLAALTTEKTSVEQQVAVLQQLLSERDAQLAQSKAQSSEDAAAYALRTSEWTAEMVKLKAAQRIELQQITSECNTRVADLTAAHRTEAVASTLRESELSARLTELQLESANVSASHQTAMQQLQAKLAEQTELCRVGLESWTSRETYLLAQLAEHQTLLSNQAVLEAQHLSRISELQARVTALTTNSQSDLERAVATSEAQLTQLSDSHRADAVARDAAHTTRVSELNALITSLTASQRELKARVESQEIALRDKDEHSATQLRTLDTLKTEHNIARLTLEAKATTLEGRCSDLQSTIDALKHTIDALTAERETVRLSLIGDVAALERRCAGLQTSLISEREAHATAVTRLREQFDERAQTTYQPISSKVAPASNADHSHRRDASLSYDSALALLIANESLNQTNSDPQLIAASDGSTALPAQPSGRLAVSVKHAAPVDAIVRAGQASVSESVGTAPVPALASMAKLAVRDSPAVAAVAAAVDVDLPSAYTWTHHPHACPSSLAVDPDDGAMYICHEEHHVCEKWSSYPQGDASGSGFASRAVAPAPAAIQWVFGTQAHAGNTKALLNGPVACVVDPWNRELYILDSGNHRVVVVQTVSGSFMRSIGESIFGASVLHFPKFMAVCRQEPLPASPAHTPKHSAVASSNPRRLSVSAVPVYVVITDDKPAVKLMDGTGRIVGRLEAPRVRGSTVAMIQPTGVALCEYQLFVADSGARRVYAFDVRTGTFSNIVLELDNADLTPVGATGEVARASILLSIDAVSQSLFVCDLAKRIPSIQSFNISGSSATIGNTYSLINRNPRMPSASMFPSHYGCDGLAVDADRHTLCAADATQHSIIVWNTDVKVSPTLDAITVSDAVSPRNRIMSNVAEPALSPRTAPTGVSLNRAVSSLLDPALSPRGASIAPPPGPPQRRTSAAKSAPAGTTATLIGK